MRDAPGRVVLLMPTTTYRADDFLAAARALGIEVVVATDRCHVLAAEYSEAMAGSLAVEFRPPGRAVAALCALWAQRPYAAIVAVDDATTVIAAEVSARLGLPGNPLTAVRAARDKRLLRERLAAAEVPQPRHRVLSIADPPGVVWAAAREVGLPCVLKPVILSASQGVIRADDEDGALAAFQRVRALLRRPEIAGAHGPAAEAVICEAFVPGAEYAVEGLLQDGELEVLAIFDKPDPLDGPFFEETIYVTPSRQPAEVQARLARATAGAAAALGLRHGPVHAELRLPPGHLKEARPVVIEVASRSIGGLCSRALRFATGRTLEELILLAALGRPLSARDTAREGDAAGVMMLPIPRAGVLAEIGGVEAAAAVPGIESITVTARVGDELVPLPEGAAYLGFAFARAATPAAVEGALRLAQARLRFTVRKALPVNV